MALSTMHRVVRCALCLALGSSLVTVGSAAGAESVAVATEPVVALPARIDVIEVRGLVRTQEFVVLRELPWRAGEIVSKNAFELGVTRLWNTPMFSQVAAHVVRRGEANVAVIDLEERWPLTPVLEFQSGGSATWFHVGATHRNLLGRYLELEGFYEYFNGESGGRIWFRNARLFDERLELRLVADRLMRPRPDYVVRTTRARIELNRLMLDDRIKLGVRADVLSDEFIAPLEGTNPSLPTTLQAGILEPTLRIGRVDTVRLRDHGVSLETRVAIGYTTRAGASTFRRVVSELNANAMTGEHWNFGLRSQAGGVVGQPDEMQFFLGGLDLLRGFKDNYFKATSYVSYNADIKYIVFDSRWLAMLPVVFSDGALIRRDDGSRDSAFSLGAGFIFVIPKIADSQLRIDLAVPLRPPYHPGVGLASAAFF
jgi:hypothetical protein